MPIKITYFVHGTTTDNENGLEKKENYGNPDGNMFLGKILGGNKFVIRSQIL